MPKIEVTAESFYSLLGKTYDLEYLESIFPAAKAELDGAEDDILKIELNDTNRPDLWSTAGLARQLRSFENASAPLYDFFSTADQQFETEGREVHVDERLRDIRPYVAGFAVTGKPIDEATLKDIIQTQEKLCWNFGRKRRSIAMGVYRSDLFSYPVQYRAADPVKTKFTPLQSDREMNLVEIIKEHPKGMEYGHIVEGFDLYPMITDGNDKVLSFPPVINSAEIGAVQEGDTNLFIELTGTVLKDVFLAASIVACDLSDAGYEILPVRIVYPYETEFGRELVCPYYFQEPAAAEISYIQKLLGENLSARQCVDALKRMGIYSVSDGGSLYITVPEYRNDFLHPVDIVEDVLIGHGLEKFTPVMPNDYTVGRLTAAEQFSRKVKDILVGMGFQEMMYNYLGSRKDYIDNMCVDGKEYIHIENPMTENYEYVRASVLPSLLHSESVSAHAVYPHHIFEVGKTAFLDDDDVSGTVTRNTLGFLSADSQMGFNEIRSTLSALMYYLGRDFTLRETEDPRFIPGRCGSICIGETRAGIFGEAHPEVLERWGIGMPTVMCEIDLDVLIGQ
jgi:phenylalanyl-tRNA synthetase beta chain